MEGVCANAGLLVGIRTWLELLFVAVTNADCSPFPMTATCGQAYSPFNQILLFLLSVIPCEKINLSYFCGFGHYPLLNFIAFQVIMNRFPLMESHLLMPWTHTTLKKKGALCFPLSSPGQCQCNTVVVWTH